MSEHHHHGFHHKHQRRKKHEITLINDDKELSLITGFSLLIILLTFAIISWSVYKNKRQPIVISSSNFARYKDQDTLPEGGGTAYTEPNKKKSTKEIKSELDYINILKSCAKNQCVIDLATGIKRCPKNANTSLVYNPTRETCTAKYGCPEVLPYSVLSNGGTDRFGQCDPGIECRCTDNFRCPDYVLSTFNLVNGNPYSPDSSSSNWVFTQELKDNTQGYTFENIKIPDDLISTKFCQLNSDYTSRIEKGCNLKQHSGEPVDCSNNRYLVFFNTDIFNANVTERWPNEPPEGDTSIIISVPNLNENKKNNENAPVLTNKFPPQGVFKTSGVDSNVGGDFLFSYDNAARLNDNSGYRLNTIVSLPEGTPGLKHQLTGTPDSDGISGPVSLLTQLYVFNSCSIHEVGSNNKNMLMCSQNRDQPCSTGQLTYNVDKSIDSRSFCQMTSAKNSISQYYNDPTLYTVSCSVGEGCGKLLDKTLKNKVGSETEYINAIREKKKKFFPEYDLGSISNIWEISNITGENFTLQGNGAVVIDTTRSLLTFENGDYWSAPNSYNQKFLIKAASSGTHDLKLNNNFDLHPNMKVSYIGNISNKIDSAIDGGISLSDNLTENLPYNTPITFYLDHGSTTCGTIGDVNEKNTNIGTFYNFTEKDKKLNPALDIKTTSNYIVYKQFGFNGINYNTSTVFNKTSKRAQRFYVPSSYWNSKIIRSTEQTDIRYPVPMSPLTILNGTIGSDTQVLSFNPSSGANFTLEKSMYYPVWNDNTFKQECIMCKPYILAFTFINDNTAEIISVQIQYSGTHYKNYIPLGERSGFYYSGFSTIKYPSLEFGLKSTTQIIILDQINPNISVGDFVVDANGNFPFKFKCSPAFPISLTYSILEIGFYEEFFDVSAITLEDKYTSLHYKNNKYIKYKPIGKVKSTDGIYFYPYGQMKNVFIGKTYVVTLNNLYYELLMVPQTTILQINKNIITTSSDISSLIDTSPNFIQFANPSESLEITPSYEEENNASAGRGIGGKLSVAHITNGRITSINVDVGGTGYLSIEKPSIYISKYKIEEPNINVI